DVVGRSPIKPCVVSRHIPIRSDHNYVMAGHEIQNLRHGVEPAIVAFKRVTVTVAVEVVDHWKALRRGLVITGKEYAVSVRLSKCLRVVTPIVIWLRGIE